MANLLRETIEAVLKDVQIETGRQEEWERVVVKLDKAIGEKIINYEIDYYTEIWRLTQ